MTRDDDGLGDPERCPNRPPGFSRCPCVLCRNVPDRRRQIALTRIGEIAVRLMPAGAS